MHALRFIPFATLNLLLVAASAAACLIYLRAKGNLGNPWRFFAVGALALGVTLSAVGPVQLSLLDEELEASLVTAMLGPAKPTLGGTSRTLGLTTTKPLHQAESENTLSTTNAPLQILLVDDHHLFREGLAQLLDPQPDMKVVGQAASASEAVFIALLLKPDVILMDINLPDGSGIEATQAILASLPETKIIALTMYTDDEHLFASIRAGAAGCLDKRASIEDLLQSLRRAAHGEATISGPLARRILDEFSGKLSAQDSTTPESIRLTAREVEVVGEVACGATNRDIADKFFISEHTARNHVHNVLAKLHLRNRRDIARYAHTHGLLLAQPNNRSNS